MPRTMRGKISLSFDNKGFRVVVLLGGLLLSAAGCGVQPSEITPSSEPVVEPTPSPLPPTLVVNNFGVRPYLSLEMPFNWDCSVITEISTGLEWQGIQIGETTYNQIIDILQPELVYRTKPLNWIVFQREEVPSHTIGVWDEISACFLGNTLTALIIYVESDEFPGTPKSLMDIYGDPDRVTWGHDEQRRTMIWVEEGIMANIWYPFGGDVFTYAAWPLLLFPPMGEEEFEGSWIMQTIPDPPSDSDLAKMPLDWRVEDPWGFNDD